MTRFRVGDYEYEVGQAINVVFYPNGPGTEPVYTIPSRIIGFDPTTERIEFESVGDSTGITLQGEYAL